MRGEIIMETKQEFMNAIMLCIGCREWAWPKYVLIPINGGVDRNRLDDIARRVFNQYKHTQSEDIDFISYQFYRSVSVFDTNNV